MLRVNHFRRALLWNYFLENVRLAEAQEAINRAALAVKPKLL